MSTQRAVANDRVEYTALSDRMSNLLLLRFALAAMVLVWAGVRPEALGVSFGVLAGVTVGYLVAMPPSGSATSWAPSSSGPSPRKTAPSCPSAAGSCARPASMPATGNAKG